MKNKYNIKILGYGGEIVLGFVKPEIYKYFQDNNINLKQYIFSEEDENIIPDEMKPFTPNSWYECDHIYRNYGILLSNDCQFIVSDKNDEIIFESLLDAKTLNLNKIALKNQGNYNSEHIKSDNVIFMGKEINEGTLFNSIFESNENFDRTKFSIDFSVIQGTSYFENIYYDNKLISCDGNRDTINKNDSFEFLIPKKNLFNLHRYENQTLTDWLSSKINPVYSGIYEVQFSNGRTGTALAEWNGVDFREIISLESPDPINSDTLHGISHWRGLNYQP